MCLGGIAILAYLWMTYKFNVSVLAIEDYYLYTADMWKPYTKMLAFSAGLMFVDFYIYFM